MFNDLRPFPNDSEVNLLGKLLERLGGTANPLDDENTLLAKMLRQLDGDAVTVSDLDARYLRLDGGILTGQLRIERPGEQTTDNPALNFAEYWNNAAVTFSLIRGRVTQTAANTQSNFLDFAKNSDLIFRVRTNGTLVSERHEGDNFENMLQIRKRGSTAGGKDAALATGVGIAALDSYGWDSASFILAARVISVTTEAFSVGNNGTELQFFATPNASATTVKRFTVGGSRVSMTNVPFRLQGFTVATLPTSPLQGDTAYVTDATAPTFLGAAVGGGAVVSPVFYNGAAWVTV